MEDIEDSLMLALEDIEEVKEDPTRKREVKAKAKGFRLNAQALFLTYPRCTLSPEEALLILTEKLNKYTLLEYIVA